MQNKRCVILPGNRSGVRSVNHTTAFVVSASAETGVAAVRRAALGLAIMFLVCGCGRGGTSEAQPEGPARAKTDQDQQQVFNGTIELLVHASGSRLVLHTARGRFEVHTTEATEYKGIAVKCGTALWRLGHRHEIRGRVVPTTARRSTYAHKQSIVASHIKYLGPPPYDPDEALDSAILTNSVSEAKKALKSGADTKRKGTLGDSLLHEAAQWSGPEIVGLLIQSGLDVNGKGYDDMTALHWAVRRSEIRAGGAPEAVVEVLLKNGADPNARDKSGKTPWECATRKRKEVRAMLAKYNAER